MPSIAVVLQEEIRLLARREIMSGTSSLDAAAAQVRRDIARLKRLIEKMHEEVAYLKAQAKKGSGRPRSKDTLHGVRHSVRSVKAQRKRLKLSAAEFGKLVGVSGLTVYNWEQGKGRPRKHHLAALVAVREMRRREAVAQLQNLPAKKPK